MRSSQIFCPGEAALPILIASSLLSGCATARLHSAQELSAVGRTCGVAEGEVIQEEDEPRLLFLYTVSPTEAQRSCVAAWAKTHHLHLTSIEAVNWTDH